MYIYTMSKLARHSAIRDLVNSQDVASQEELRRRLYRRGHRVTQATLSRDIHEFWFHLGDVQIEVDGQRRHVAAVENIMTGERSPIEWGGIRLRIDPWREPALLFRCLG